MKENSKLTVMILIIITIVVVVFSSLFGNQIRKQEEEKIQIVTNYSNFYTVNSCLYRFVTYLHSKDKESIMLILNDTYKNKNKITTDNVLNKLPNVDVDSTFVSNKMYYQQLKNNVTKYYVRGYIEENQISDNFDTNKLNRNEVYFIVYLDTEQKIFSIEPYSGDIFMDGENNEE